MITIGSPSESRSWSSSRRMWLRLLASSALTGSSQISSRGSVASARAIDTRWRWPPEIWPGVRSQHRRVQADLVQRGQRPAGRISAGVPLAADPQPLADDLGHGQVGVERAQRVLEDQLQVTRGGARPAGRRRAARRSACRRTSPGPGAGRPGRPRSGPGWSCPSRSRRPGRRSRPARPSGRRRCSTWAGPPAAAEHHVDRLHLEQRRGGRPAARRGHRAASSRRPGRPGPDAAHLVPVADQRPARRRRRGRRRPRPGSARRTGSR